MFGRIGIPELIVIFVVVLLLFGAKALPDIAKGLAQAIRVFKREAKEVKDGLEGDQVKDDTSQPQQPSTSSKDSNDFDPNAEKRDWRPKSDNVSDSEKV